MNKLTLGVTICLLVATLVAGCGTLKKVNDDGASAVTTSTDFSYEDEAVYYSQDGEVLPVAAKVNKTVNCGAKGCFDKNFLTCEPASLTITVPDEENYEMYYEIKKKESDTCEVYARMNKYPLPQWVGAEMVCFLKPSRDFDKTMHDARILNKGCTGKLAGLM